MQPPAALGNDPGTAVRLIKGMGAGSQQNSGSGTLNNEAFWRKKVEEVPVNQVRGICPIWCSTQFTCRRISYSSTNSS